MKNMKMYKLTKTIVFFGYLFIVLQSILTLQTDYPDIIKGFYGTEVVTYIGMGILIAGWISWEISIAKQNIIFLGFSLAALITATAMITGIIGLVGFALAIAGIILFGLNLKDSKKFIILKNKKDKDAELKNV